MFLVIVGIAVFLVAGALVVSLNNARVLWMQVVPREERLMMTAVACLGLAVACFGAAWTLWARRTAGRAARQNRLPH
jgi:type II secretory pathway component PulM